MSNFPLLPCANIAIFPFQDARYDMSGPFMGHGVIINTVAKEFPQTKLDSEAMAKTLTQIGFKIQHHENCNRQVILFLPPKGCI